MMTRTTEPLLIVTLTLEITSGQLRRLLRRLTRLHIVHRLVESHAQPELPLRTP
jgi:hypothetical protein